MNWLGFDASLSSLNHFFFQLLVTYIVVAVVLTSEFFRIEFGLFIYAQVSRSQWQMYIYPCKITVYF
ncbi:hypothetical protein RIF29_18821 [Crotalaria pallida]|uniref:Uncharacterized protein n=1 Tax=Crotalaria pallida TaxID=3830 RepID=A0AAN9F044_CROPI